MTQSKAILERLQQAPNQWVSMIELSKAPTHYGLSQAFATHSRIADLRREGYDIDNRTEVEGRRKKSYYRLNVKEPVQAEMFEF